MYLAALLDKSYLKLVKIVLHGKMAIYVTSGKLPFQWRKVIGAGVIVRV